MEEIIPKLKSFLGLLIRTAGFTLRSIEARKEDEKTVKVELFVDGAGLMIGENGENIFSWEDVLNQWLRKNSEGFLRVWLDINSYRWQNEQRLRELAKKSAREAVLSKNPVRLPTMSSYERRIIHTELALHPNVATESEGKDPERRVIIKPI
ncbi:MAG: R3H domain protein [Parcubacteria group bacterium GW2011_GWC1_45_9]|nr:MAG: R3H domain protein [Parcubacteria group bacterium GW2011_GWA1_Parcubacteria_45_10]KKT88717.1 MAG: R3H domain protein [Parcubacteria group bacterium GW2011_GWB1_45_10]KKU17463.1 MAG: R3H domain protein [Parcubacteria group bacterium GW2011_GWC1_45_9]HCI05197.1 hypothetical protein [Patescibacteria group bacterium]